MTSSGLDHAEPTAEGDTADFPARGPTGFSPDAVEHTEDRLFPQPQSPAGRLLGHLVALQVPGTPIETSLATLLEGVRLPPDVGARTLSQLAGDGLILLETEPESDRVNVTVLLAPPLAEFGIRPQWGDAPREPSDDQTDVAPVLDSQDSCGEGQRAMRKGPGVVQQTEATRASTQDTPETQDSGPNRQQTGRGENSTELRALFAAAPSADGGGVGRGAARASRLRDVAASPPAALRARAQEGRGGNSSASRPASAAGATESLSATQSGDATRTPGVTRAAGVITAADAAHALAAANVPLPDSTHSPGEVPVAGRPPAGRTGSRRAEGGVTVDETAMARGFVDRFERLLAECDTWRRRAQQAEEHLTTTEKLLRVAERRIESVELRLAEAQERLRSWTELTQRMQQLSRQADQEAKSKKPGTSSKVVGGNEPGTK